MSSQIKIGKDPIIRPEGLDPQVKYPGEDKPDDTLLRPQVCDEGKCDPPIVLNWCNPSICDRFFEREDPDWAEYKRIVK